jgi:hypothetical protein
MIKRATGFRRTLNSQAMVAILERVHAHDDDKVIHRSFSPYGLAKIAGRIQAEREAEVLARACAAIDRSRRDPGRNLPWNYSA